MAGKTKVQDAKADGNRERELARLDRKDYLTRRRGLSHRSESEGKKEWRWRGQKEMSVLGRSGRRAGGGGGEREKEE